MANLINLANSDVDKDASLEGYDAYDSADEKLGGIDGVIADADSMQPRYVVVDSGGWFSSKKFVVPAGDIRDIDDDQRRVNFTSLTKRTLESGTYPQYDESWWDQNDHAKFSQHEREIATAYQPKRNKTAPVEHDSEMYRPAKGAQRLQLMEERLTANKERHQAGTVKIGKRITERTESMEVPLREERVVIERTAGSGQPVEGKMSMGKEQTIEVPVTKERATLEKDTVVTEEVGVRTEAVERTERLSGTVRKEELEIDDSAHLAEGREPDLKNMPRSERVEREQPRRG